MLQYTVRRLVLMLPVLLVVTLMVFSLMLLLPGDPAMALLGENLDPEAYTTVRKALGLDQPVPVQYVRWLSKTFQGDLGRSLHTREPVLTIIGTHLPRTLYLTLAAMLVSLIIAIPAGVIAALRRNSFVDTVATVLAMVGVAVPNFWLGVMCILFFSVTLGWLPVSGYVGPLENPWLSLQHMVLPAITLGTAIAAEVTRMTRSSLLEVLDRDYILTARAKGLGERSVILAHALKNALIPVVTIVGLQMGRLFGGAVVTESIFAVPGLGTLLVSGIFSRDFPIVQAVVLVMALAVLSCNLIVDLLYTWLDPRIRYHS
jgi:peptide/nickel transport system permease protein